MPYLDANATEPLRPEARSAILAALDTTGNPSSVHRDGRAARRIQEDARETLAARFGARPAHLVFVSGGTEASALALHALGAGRRRIISAVEHDAVRAAAPDAAVLPVGRDGVADPDALRHLLASGPPALVCLMHANNETGVIQPVAEAAALCRAHGALLHVDAVQTAGRLATARLDQLGCDSMAISAHKLGGPAGVGALLLAPHITLPRPLIGGGGQERGWRGGTPPVALIAGFAAAALASTSADHLAPLRDRAEAAAIGAGAIVCGAGAPRLSNTTCLALPGLRADAQVIALDLDGVAVSAGAACSAGKVARSHVLAAMGLGPLAAEAIRVSLPWNAGDADIDAFITAYRRMATRLRPALARRAA